MRRSFISIMAFVMFLPLNLTYAAAGGSLPFDDIRYNYATEAIINMSNHNIITGTEIRTFEPDNPITRAEFVTMLDRLLGIEPVSSAVETFEDVPRTAWYYPWVQPAIQLNIVNGVSDVRFEPDRTVTREEAAVMLNRALKQLSSSASIIPESLYQDQDNIHSWAISSVFIMHALGLMEGDDGSFRPRDSMTRQEAAVIMNRVWTRSDWADRLRSSPPARIQLGWQYGQTTAQFERQIEKSNVNTLSPRWFFLGNSGVLENGVDPSLIAWAHRNGMRVWAMVGNRSDSVNTHDMLTDSSHRLAFIQELTAQVKQYGIDGLNIDFENMLPEDRDAFTAFVSELHAAMASVYAVLSINVSPDFGTDWTEVFDYAALGNNAEYVVLMGYDEHWGGSQIPGSVSSLPWLRTGLETLLAKVPARKVILALPLYTRKWAMDPIGRVDSLDWSLVQQNATVNACQLKPVWDDILGQYYTQYSESTMLNRIWMEDGRSLARKMTLGESYSLAGYGYWYMGGENVDVWASLRNAAKFGSYDFS